MISAGRPSIWCLSTKCTNSPSLNKAMEGGISTLLARESLYVIWQTGSAYFNGVSERVAAHPRLRLLKYVDRMDLTYTIADLVLSRSGAISCSELMVTGSPAVLVPSPNVAEDHQTKNAESMVSAGAAMMLPERELKDNWVSNVLNLLDDEARRNKMRASALTLARPEAADNIAKSILSIINVQ